jgi:hypothetical protein
MKNAVLILSVTLFSLLAASCYPSQNVYPPEVMRARFDPKALKEVSENEREREITPFIDSVAKELWVSSIDGSQEQ